MEIKYKNILVCGLGKSGLASARLAIQKGLSCTLCDGKPDFERRPEIKDLVELGAKCLSVGQIAEAQFDLAIMSPGIAPDKKIFLEAKKSSQELMGELDFASLFMPKTEFFAISGTNGKTTAVLMAEYALEKLGIKALACGNIGLPLAEVAQSDEYPQVAIVEISSYQIDLLKCMHFSAGIILNITEDHIDRYGSFENYAKSKCRLASFCEDFYVGDKIELEQGWKTISCNNRAADFSLVDNTFHASSVAFELPNLGFYGKHNQQNSLAASVIANKLGLGLQKFFETLADFKCSEHRMERVCERNQVLFINDSKSTNPASLEVALQCFANKSKKILLIAGGRDKNMDLSVVNPLISKYVKKVFSYGECRYNLFKIWHEATDLKIAESFEQAVTMAVEAAEPKDVVLLSPGCSSLDLFSSFEERGNKFKSLVL